MDASWILMVMMLPEILGSFTGSSGFGNLCGTSGNTTTNTVNTQSDTTNKDSTLGILTNPIAVGPDALVTGGAPDKPKVEDYKPPASGLTDAQTKAVNDLAAKMQSDDQSIVNREAIFEKTTQGQTAWDSTSVVNAGDPNHIIGTWDWFTNSTGYNAVQTGNTALNYWGASGHWGSTLEENGTFAGNPVAGSEWAVPGMSSYATSGSSQGTKSYLFYDYWNKYFGENGSDAQARLLAGNRNYVRLATQQLGY